MIRLKATAVVVRRTPKTAVALKERLSVSDARRLVSPSRPEGGSYDASRTCCLLPPPPPPFLSRRGGETIPPSRGGGRRAQIVLTAVMAALAGATTMETPEAPMARRGGTAIAELEVLMLPLMLADLAEMCPRTALLPASMKPTAWMTPVEAPQREEWRFAEDSVTEVVERGGD